ncbi:branched-chain amino acid--2-keto-4-methylthiobutyrate aminotransferase [Roseibium alexandrii]|uniref:Probable branched-chain-amino-acid aminotransferase n=1 Tax=Roseibium alexandrii (strain DSM 17067 / NCIMB 14079 / DFL-11) TaxID=244592 RepID=A0A5E8GTH8_ROSAD|nr:branched-chain amino acid--2-keto-4-methylthiobutyrate aminotransferase [Roseibium alexandrii]EEE43073.1 Branched-chain amino acid aminotransferase/4-amino-4-deoxychorismate lyase [Roseibium alexandrii DFL-11]
MSSTVDVRVTISDLSNGAAWMGGRLMPISEAALPVTDWGLIHSDITYDVVPVLDGAFFRLPHYLARFRRSMDELRLDPGLSDEEMEDALQSLVAATGLRKAYVAMVTSRGVNQVPGSRDPRDCKNQFFAWCVPYVHVIRPEIAERGAHVHIAKTVHRISPGSVNPKVKNYHWGDFTKGLFEAKDHGAETVILLDDDGNVTEGPGFNVFAVKGRTLVTAESGVLEGISRQTVLDIAAEQGLEIEIRALALSEFFESDEVFITTSGGGVAPVTRVDDRIFSNDAPGPITTALHKAYFEWAARPDNRTEISYRD